MISFFFPGVAILQYGDADEDGIDDGVAALVWALGNLVMDFWLAGLASCYCYSVRLLPLLVYGYRCYCCYCCY